MAQKGGPDPLDPPPWIRYWYTDISPLASHNLLTPPDFHVTITFALNLMLCCSLGSQKKTPAGKEPAAGSRRGMRCRGGSRNSLRGGGFWARILRRWGLGSRSLGIFIYWQAKKKKKTSEGGGGGGFKPPPPWIRYWDEISRPDPETAAQDGSHPTLPEGSSREETQGRQEQRQGLLTSMTFS